MPADDGIAVPSFLYGTAWKEDDTARLTELALSQGFRGIDTANQRKHYHEAGVGEGIAKAVEAGVVTRADLFLQTKFTYRRGQDHRLPYDPAAPLAQQVAQSFASSLDHLKTDRLDSYVLHGPSHGVGLTPDDWDVWRAMEALVAGGKVRFLGVSNVALDQLRLLCKDATVRPRFVQNRCYAARGWDRTIRQFCQAEGLVYQGFSLLTANSKVLGKAEMTDLARRYGRSPAQIVFRFAQQVGMLPLTGTRDARHMQEDLASSLFQLDAKDVAAVEAMTGG
jgi:diketogulonate reductase-like aldo/keto reductase